MDAPIQVINAIAPIRICDVGGWTDTWFAGHGRVFNLAVYPYAEVQVLVHSRRTTAERILVRAENYDLSFPIAGLEAQYDKLPLVSAAIRRMAIPDDLAIELILHCAVPPGASTGTSAAISVAIIGALDLLSPGRLTPYEVARLAHATEVEDLGLQCGVQDQLASAYGGINLIDIGSFPHAAVSPLQLPIEQRWELERRLSLVYVGRPHQSSAIHRQVIAALGQDAQADPRLEELRHLALEAKDALLAGDWCAFGQVLERNTAVQRHLHPGLVGEAFERVMAIARTHGSLGCKVNGAGGDGGSITILSDGLASGRRRLWQALAEAGFQMVPVHLASEGVRAWRSAPLQ